ncbi:hypothetical protein GALL_312670 [mine drainage metagenome]|uniref:Lipoprotein n=1 Tax=mine drainage metagenome TaxID=410659 RepID=A0A1J5RFG3_9ZZZZ
MDRLVKTAVKLIAIPLALATLAGCGGGGGGGSAAPAATTVSGVAAKGIIMQARVLVCRIVNGTPEADATCAATVTGSDGSYSVTLNDGYSGPALIKVVAGSGSTMIDETTGLPIPYSLTLRALVPAVSANTSAYVTPFSDMVAAALGNTNIDANQIRLQITAVQSLMSSLGIDLSVKPLVDIRNNGADAAMLGMQANMVKQLTRLMLAAQTSTQLQAADGSACAAAGTTPQQIACAVTAMDRIMTQTQTQTRTAAVLAALANQNVATVNLPIINSDGTFSRVNVNIASAAAMQAAMQAAGLTSAATVIPGMMGRMH